MKTIINIITWFSLIYFLVGCQPAEKQNHLRLAKDAIQSNAPSLATKHLKEALLSESNNIEARLILGKLYLESGLLLKAKGNFEKILEIQPDNLLALLLKGKVLLKEGKYHELNNHINAVDFENTEEKYNFIGLQASALIAQNKLDSASMLLSEIDSERASGKEYQIAKIQLQIAQENEDEANNSIRKALLDFPHDTELKLIKIRHQLHHGNANTSSDQYEKFTNIENPEYSPEIAQEATYSLIKNRVTEGELGQAEKLVHSLLSSQPKDHRALYLGGLVALISGNYGLAERRLIKLEKSYSIKSVRMLLGVLHMINKSYEKSRFYLANYYASQRDDIWAAKLLVRNYLILDDYQNAKQILDDIESHNTNYDDDAELLILGAMLDINLEKMETATHKLEAAEQLISDDPAARKLLAKVNLDHGRITQSLIHSKFALDQSPNDQIALSLVVSSYIQQKDRDNIENIIRQFIEVNGNSSWIDSTHGIALLELGHLAEAETKLEQALSIETNQALAKIGLARVTELRGNHQLARNLYYKEALRIDYRDEALNGIIRTAYASHDLKNIRSAIEISRKYNYKSVDPLIYLGAHFIKKKDFSEAQGVIKDIQILDRDHPGQKLLLAGIEIGKDNFSVADKIVSRALESAPNYQPLLTLQSNLNRNLKISSASNLEIPHVPTSQSSSSSTTSISAETPGYLHTFNSQQLGASKDLIVQDWFENIAPAIGSYSSEYTRSGKPMVQLLGLNNAERLNSNINNTLGQSSESARRNYFYGRKGALARINRTLFFKVYGSMSGGTVSESLLSRRLSDGVIDGVDVYDEGKELREILWKDKRWKVRRNDKRSLRMPSLLAFSGLILILLVVGVRWRRNKSATPTFNDDRA